MRVIIPPYIPNVNPISKKTSPLMHATPVTQQPHASLSNVPKLSSLGLPRGGGGTLGVSISAINNPHWMIWVIRYNC